jgi:hypothetical protein
MVRLVGAFAIVSAHKKPKNVEHYGNGKVGYNQPVELLFQIFANGNIRLASTYKSRNDKEKRNAERG